jgi:death on curing protein
VSSVIYLSADEVWAINEQVLRGSGGIAGLRDRGALESAVARPQTRAFYEEADLIDQAATLIVGLALAHAFVDGNKPHRRHSRRRLLAAEWALHYA